MMTDEQFNNITDEEAQAYLDELRELHPINGALQDLGIFIVHTRENQGMITVRNALYLAEAAETVTNMMLPELLRIEADNAKLRQRIKELTFIAAGMSNQAGNA